MIPFRTTLKGAPLRWLITVLATVTCIKGARVLENTIGQSGFMTVDIPVISRALAAANPVVSRKTSDTSDGPKLDTKTTQDKTTDAVFLPPVSPIPPSEEALLSQLRDRRLTVQQQELELEQKRQLVGQAEQKLVARADQLSKLQVQLEHLEALRREHEEANWKGLVKTYETMRPRDAASIMNDLDLPTTLQVLDRMKEAKAGMVLAAMTPDRARLVTTELAQLRNKTVTVQEIK